MSTVMKISPQGQVRIPKKIMGKLGLGKGDYVEVEIIRNEIVLKPRKLKEANCVLGHRPSKARRWIAYKVSSMEPGFSLTHFRKAFFIFKGSSRLSLQIS
jgi:AbrB family looped-hinge helix DNA binding protein